MTRQSTYNEMEPVIDEAVRRSTQPNQQSRMSGAGRGSLTHEDSATTADASGYTIHPFITNLDSTNDLHAVTMP